jgi:DNA-binding MarR family transcriptional regulator
MNKQATNKVMAKKVRENSVGWMLKMLTGCLDPKMKQELKSLDLDLLQFAVLMTLLEEEELTQTGIGKRITLPSYATTRTIDALEEYATTRTIDALEEKHLVERRKDESSRRSHRIFLTDEGHAIAPQLFAIVKSVNDGFLSALDAAEKKQLKAILKKLLSTNCPNVVRE